MYCDECAIECEGECPYHDYYQCNSCGEDDTVHLVHVSANPDDGDEWLCDSCDWSTPA